MQPMRSPAHLPPGLSQHAKKQRRHNALLVHLWKFYTSLDMDVLCIWGKFLFLLHTKGLKLGFVVDPLHMSHLQTFADDLDSFGPLAFRGVIRNQQCSSASQWQGSQHLGRGILVQAWFYLCLEIAQPQTLCILWSRPSSISSFSIWQTSIFLIFKHFRGKFIRKVILSLCPRFLVLSHQ